MPKEIPDKMGIKFKAYPHEIVKAKDRKLIALLISFLTDDQREIIKDVLGEDYFNEKMKAIEKLEAIKEFGGVYDVSTGRKLGADSIY
jgi:hypothetical protein